MNFPSDTPKMQKWMFWVGDVLLIAAAWFIHDGADHPNGGVALILTVFCIVAAVFVAVIPAIVEYARRQDEALDNRQRSLQALAATIAAASEQVSIAATGLQGIAEAAQDNFSRSERLSQQINERIAELETRLASVKRDDGEAAAKLESVAKKIGKAAAEFEASIAKAAEAAKAAAAAAAAAVIAPEPPPVIASRIVEIRPAVSSSDHPFEKPAEPPPPVPAEPPRMEEVSPAEPEHTPAAELASPASEIDVAPAAVPRKRSPRKPKPAPEASLSSAEPPPLASESPAPAPETPAPIEEPLALAKETPASAPDFALESPPAEEPAPPAPEVSEPAISSDGATRLVVTAYIGIGNRIFIRGDGPGLSWEKGVPLNFISIGKRRWESHDAVSTVRFKLFKNDQVECTALGESSVEPGAQRELNASF
jgi:uncharacterized protein YoxC